MKPSSSRPGPSRGTRPPNLAHAKDSTLSTREEELRLFASSTTRVATLTPPHFLFCKCQNGIKLWRGNSKNKGEKLDTYTHASPFQLRRLSRVPARNFFDGCRGHLSDFLHKCPFHHLSFYSNIFKKFENMGFLDGGGGGIT